MQKLTHKDRQVKGACAETYKDRLREHVQKLTQIYMGYGAETYRWDKVAGAETFTQR